MEGWLPSFWLVGLCVLSPRPVFAAPVADPDQHFLKLMDSKRIYNEFDFKTTKELWRKLDVDPDEIEKAGPVKLAGLPFVYLTKYAGTAATLPFDLLAAPVRTHLALRWEFSGQVLDSAGAPLSSATVHIAVASCEEDIFGEGSPCTATATTDSDGRFSCILAGEFVEHERIGMVATVNWGTHMLQREVYLVRRKGVVTLEIGDPPAVPNPKEFQLRFEPQE